MSVASDGFEVKTTYDLGERVDRQNKCPIARVLSL